MVKLVGIVVAVLVGIGLTGCRPHEVAWYLNEATPEQRAAVDNHLRALAEANTVTDCYSAQRVYFPEANGWGPRVIRRESNNNPSAANSSSSARGCWQLLMSLHSHRFWAVGCSPAQWADPICNTKAARHLYLAAGTSPWALTL